MTTTIHNVTHHGHKIVAFDGVPTKDAVAAGFRVSGGFYARDLTRAELDLAAPIATTDSRPPSTDTQERPTMSSMINPPGRAELIHEHQQKIRSAEPRQQRTGDAGTPVSNAEINRRNRAFYAKDALLTTNTPSEAAANTSRIAALSGTDLGKVWDSTSQLSPERRAEVMDAVRRARDTGEVRAIMERYGFGSEGNWSAAGNGTMFTGKATEQGPAGAAMRATGFQDADLALSVSRIKELQANNVASRNR